MQNKSNGSVDWVHSLKEFVSSRSQRSMEEIDAETESMFLKYIQQDREQASKEDPSYKKIPKFFTKSAPVNNENDLLLIIKQEARERLLQQKLNEVLERKDLEQIWDMLKKNTSAPKDGKERVDYKTFTTLAAKMPQKSKKFVTPSLFLKFERDDYGRIEIVSLFHSIVRRANLFEARINLAYFDTQGNGYLKEKDMENFISSIIPKFAQLKNLQEDFHTYYIITAVRKFFFFLDPKRTGKIFIKDILASPILFELHELKQEKANIDVLAKNWFSIQSTIKIYEKYVKLDTDRNGLLKKSELAKYNWGFTDIFIDRVFEEYKTYEGEMDYKNYLDFILAVENKKHNSSLQYFWRILDVNKKGAIDTYTVNMFFRPVVQKLESKDKVGYNADDVKDEIFDIIKPKVPTAFTLDDLIKCNQGDVIVSMLIDARGFFAYDQRESGNTLDNEEIDDF